MMLDDYLSLVTSQHKHRPRFMAVMEALLTPLCEVDDLLQSMRTAFDLDSAVGVQLDKTGEWIGRSRNLSLPWDGGKDRGKDHMILIPEW
jgi:hypothetical protein